MDLDIGLFPENETTLKNYIIYEAIPFLCLRIFAENLEKYPFLTYYIILGTYIDGSRAVYCRSLSSRGSQMNR